MFHDAPHRRLQRRLQHLRLNFVDPHHNRPDPTGASPTPPFELVERIDASLCHQLEEPKDNLPARQPHSLLSLPPLPPLSSLLRSLPPSLPPSSLSHSAQQTVRRGPSKQQDVDAGGGGGVAGAGAGAGAGADDDEEEEEDQGGQGGIGGGGGGGGRVGGEGKDRMMMMMK
eukprot:544154-Hanusia_phi.AAC.1